MAGKLRRGSFGYKEQRELIAAAASGATVSELAAKLGRPTETIERQRRHWEFGSKGERSNSG